MINESIEFEYGGLPQVADPAILRRFEPPPPEPSPPGCMAAAAKAVVVVTVLCLVLPRGFIYEVVTTLFKNLDSPLKTFWNLCAVGVHYPWTIVIGSVAVVSFEPVLIKKIENNCSLPAVVCLRSILMVLYLLAFVAVPMMFVTIGTQFGR